MSTSAPSESWESPSPPDERFLSRFRIFQLLVENPKISGGSGFILSFVMVWQGIGIELDGGVKTAVVVFFVAWTVFALTVYASNWWNNHRNLSVIGVIISAVALGFVWWAYLPDPPRAEVPIEKNVESRPPLEEIKQPEVKAEEGKSNIIVVGYNKLPTIYDPVARVFKEGFADQGMTALVVEFRNAHERDKVLSEAKNIRAHISFEPFEFYENLRKGIKNPKENVSGWQSVDDGVWLEEPQPLIEFARGETKTLILATQFPDGMFAAYSHPIEHRAGTQAPFPRLRMLTAGKYVVKVQITGGAHGEVYELHPFTITLRSEFNISYG